jgi:putative ABC transport system permease protein
MAIWRAVGASPFTVFSLLIMEAFLISLLSCLLSVVLLYASLNLLHSWIDQTYGIWININMLSFNEIMIFIYFILAALLISLLPATRAYWFSINDGMTIKI